MKKYALAILVFAIVATGVIFAFAQQKKEGGERPFVGGRPPFPPPFFFGKMADELNLSEEQKTQIKQILDNEKTKVEPLMEAMRATHEQLETQGTNGTFDEARVGELANRQAETTRQLVIEKEKTKAAIFAVLTAEQRAKAAELKKKFDDKMRGGGFGKRFGGRDRGGADRDGDVPPAPPEF